MGCVFVVSHVERNEGDWTLGIFDDLDKARAYVRVLQLQLEEDFTDNTTTYYEIEEWDIL